MSSMEVKPDFKSLRKYSKNYKFCKRCNKKTNHYTNKCPHYTDKCPQINKVEPLSNALIFLNDISCATIMYKVQLVPFCIIKEIYMCHQDHKNFLIFFDAIMKIDTCVNINKLHNVIEQMYIGQNLYDHLTLIK